MLNANEADGDFLDLVYGAAIEPGLWNGVLEQLCTILDGSEAQIAIQDETLRKASVLFVRADPAAAPLYEDYFVRCNPLLETRDRPHGLRVLTDESKIAKQDFLRTEFYNDFLRRFGAHSLLIARLALDLPSTTTITVIRPPRREPFGRGDIHKAERLHPHLIRAYRLTSRLGAIGGFDGTREALLELSGQAVFVLDARAHVRYANRTAEILASNGDPLSTKTGSLVAKSMAATKKLQALIGAASAADQQSRSGGAMVIERPGRRPLSVTVVPIRGERLALFGLTASVLVCVNDPAVHVVAPDGLLHDVFGFTPAEERVAAHLLRGCDPRETGRQLGVSYYTVRAHLARMFDKTGTNRQADLVSLLMRSSWNQSAAFAKH